MNFEICNGKDYGVDTTQCRGTQVTGGGTANTKGSWTQIAAATSADIHFLSAFIDVQDAFGSSAAQPFLVDIGIGAAGSEIALIPNLLWSNPGQGGRQMVSVALPIFIPAGTRISARCQSNAAFQNWVYVSVTGYDAAFTEGRSYCGVDALNANAATSSGTQLSGTTANTFGAWTQIVASAAKEYAGLFMLWDDSTQNGNQISFVYDVGIGASGSEIAVLPKLRISGGSLGAGACGVFHPIRIPSGSRLAARYEGNAGGGNPSPAPSVAVYGVF
jgi:hypothetical protein